MPTLRRIPKNLARSLGGRAAEWHFLLDGEVVGWRSGPGVCQTATEFSSVTLAQRRRSSCSARGWLGRCCCRRGTTPLYANGQLQAARTVQVRWATCSPARRAGWLSGSAWGQQLGQWYYLVAINHATSVTTGPRSRSTAPHSRRRWAS